ncbi:MAG: tetratricopeptide repeat protein [Deltaproteobacteria bacterium]|nr:tetratricopeptide repeat protein [Deltaproteobacteria bacterium]
MTRYRYVHLLGILHSLFAIGLLSLLGCGRPPGLGIGGQYLDGRAEVIRQRGNIKQSVVKLEEVDRKDPFYRDSLTLLGRAYYKDSRYRDALQLLKRALAVKEEDEIAWLTLGLAQLRLGDDEYGLKSVKGGLTLLGRVSKEGYRGYAHWDRNGSVRAALRRAVLEATRGLEEKRRIIQSTEALLARVDEEAQLQEREAALATQESGT